MINNGSFEGNPADATMPRGWQSCSTGTTPDILPGFWGVYKTASHGSSFLGLIVRPDGSFESIGQRLSRQVFKNSCYKTSIDLALSKAYAGFGQALKLKIWLGNHRGQRSFLIFESPWIDHESWRTYAFEFTPDADYDYIIIETSTSGIENYRGSILLDNLKNIVLCSKA